MSASPVKIAITPLSGSVPECKPNLLPFHISYNGPAAVSAFMQVDKLVADAESAESQDCEQQVQKDGSPVGDGTPPAIVSGVDVAPPIEDVDKRFTSTFRGRPLHGLTIDLPDGYVGLVLKATSDRAHGKERTGRGDVQSTKDGDVDVEMEPRGQRRRGRLRSSAAPRKGTVITISDDDNAHSSNSSNLPDGDDVEMAEAPSTSNELDVGPLRTLVPTARFDSFTLWQADRMVNKSNDEYWRSLTEWIGLAHEIHNVDG